MSKSTPARVSISKQGPTNPRGLATFSPEAVFVLAGISQNVGTILAKSLFSDIRPPTLAWIRIMFAAVVLLSLSWRHWVPGVTARPFSRADVRTAAIFGCAIALMNLCFYLAIDRLDLGKGMSIEFIGPIVVAASRTRTRRNAIAVALAAVGVVLMSSFELGGNRVGLLFIFLASAMWATYIVLGSRVARQDRGLAGLGIGLVFGSILIAPFGVSGSAEVFTTPDLLLGCCLVGLFTTVIGQGLDQHVLRRIPPGRFALLLALLPVNATIMAYIALDEKPRPLDLVGIALVIAGIVYQQRDELPLPVDEPVQ